MKKVLIVLVALFEVSAFANVFPGVAQKLVEKQITISPSDSPCADFTGNWKGKCDGSDEEHSFQIKQIGCSFLGSESGDGGMPIGGQVAASIAIPTSNEIKDAALVQTAVQLNWNKDRNAILTSGGVNVLPLNNEKQAAKVTLTGEMRLVGNSMVNSFHVMGHSVTCSYIKQ